MKVIACLPIYKMMSAPAVQTLISFQADIYSKDDNLEIVFANNYTASVGRQKMFEYAAKHKADYVLSLDSDHIYSAKALYKLIDSLEKHNLDLLSAKYRVRTAFDENIVTALRYKEENGKAEFLKNDKDKGLVEADIVGLGFLLLRHSFIKEMVDKYDNLFQSDRFKNYADDVIFCGKCRDEGKKLYFDAGIQVGHLAEVVLK